MGILALKGDLNLSQISVSQFMNGPFGKLQAEEKNPTLCLSIKVSGDVYQIQSSFSYGYSYSPNHL